MDGDKECMVVAGDVEHHLGPECHLPLEGGEVGEVAVVLEQLGDVGGVEPAQQES